jgi:predicted Ser/Thr protein kinase
MEFGEHNSGRGGEHAPDAAPGDPEPISEDTPTVIDAAATDETQTLSDVRAPAPAAASQEPARKTLGPYEIISELGRGGMGVVYRGRQPGLDREVAIKVMLGGNHATPEQQARFAREARAAGRLRHPRIVRVFDVGEHEGLPYIVMDFVPGRSLDDVIGDAGPLDAGDAADLTRAVAEGMHHAHESGVIHRDLKPANVIIGGEGRPFVTDFGLAREVSAEGLTASGTALGTPQYMAPEQARGEATDPRTDVYGIGAILYECLVGRPPFEGDSPLAVLARVIREDPVPPSRLALNVPRQLELICLTALAKEPERRYASAAALAEDCRRFLADEPIAASAPSLAYRVRRGVRRHRAALLAAVAALLATCVAVYLMAIRPRQLERSEDRSALVQAVDAKRRREADWRAMLQGGAFDDAVRDARDMRQGPPGLPVLHDTAHADASSLDALNAPYAVSLAEALLRRGEHRLRRGDARGTGDLGAAFSVGRDEALGRTAARRALVLLAQQRWEMQEVGATRRALRLCRAEFGPLSAGESALLAAAAQRAGAVAEAVETWRALRDDEAHGADASSALELLEWLLPARSMDPLPGGSRCADLDGDGRAEVITVSRDWRLSVRRLSGAEWELLAELPLWEEHDRQAPRRIHVIDADQDGRPEIVVSGGTPEAGPGRIVVVDWNGGEPRVRATAPLGTVCYEMQVLDLDGDGRTELVANCGWYDRDIRVYDLAGDVLTERFRWPAGVEVLHLAPLGPERFVTWFGPWTLQRPAGTGWFAGRPGVAEGTGAPGPWGYRVAVWRRGSDGVVREESATPERFQGFAAVWVSDRTLVVSAEADRKLRKACPDALHGLYRIDFREGRPQPLVRIGRDVPEGAVVRGLFTRQLGGAPQVWFVSRAGVLYAIPVDGSASRSVRLPHAGGLALADLDGDGDHEGLLVADRGERVLLCGSGAVTPNAEADPVAPAARGARLAAGENLMAVGLYEEVVAACEERLRAGADARTSLRQGRALGRLGRWKGAVKAFRAAARDPSVELEALDRLLHALIEARDWPELLRVATELSARPASGVSVVERARRIQAWAAEILALRSRFAWRSGEPTAGWLSENPLSVAARSDGLYRTVSSANAQSVFGPTLKLDGGPVRMRVTFRLPALEWATALNIGFQHLDAVEFGKGRSGTSLVALNWTALGMTNRPDLHFRLACSRADSRNAGDGLPDDVAVPSSESTYVAEIEYLPGPAWTVARLRTAKGGVVGRELLARDCPDLGGGNYVIGIVARYRGGKGSGRGEEVCAAIIESIEVEGSRSVRRVDAAMPGPRTRVAQAGGLLVAGRTQEAADAFDVAIAQADRREEHRTRCRGRLFRALARFRLGDREGATADVRDAVAIDAEQVARLLINKAPSALAPAERDFLRAAAGR